MVKMACVSFILALLAAIFLSALLSIILARHIEGQKRKEQMEIDKILEEADPAIREMKMQAYWMKRGAKAAESNAAANWISAMSGTTKPPRA